MIPVLYVRNPDTAFRQIEENFGFEISGNLACLGDQSIMIVAPDTRLSNFFPLRFDHLAISVPDVDAVHRECVKRGAKLDKNFTPDGPREISAFWESGVRFVFFEGPDLAPIEFCETIGRAQRSNFEHGHYGIRCTNIAQKKSELLPLNATGLASYCLKEHNSVTNVEFLKCGSDILELFDEPDITPAHHFGWAGFIRS